MLFILSGAAIASVGGGGLWYLLPENGQTHRLATTPFLGTVIPIGIVCTLAIGVTMFIAGVANF